MKADEFFPMLGGVVLFHIMLIGLGIAIGVTIKWIKNADK